MAYQLLYQTDCPSWLYEVEMGGTSMWESWGAVDVNGGVSTYSYNHYAFGCVADWMYRTIGGLQMVEPGYRRFRVAPDVENCGLTHATMSFESPYGRIEIAWELDEATSSGTRPLHLHVVVPANTQAEVCLSGTDVASVGSGTHDFFGML
ncbi:MAG: hypothetical protein IKG22_09660 [Atopobiaceae bacterium]|nr:hypothetical protein [Atopobiaceae bacterium]